MTCSLLLFWFNRPLWGLIVYSEWYRAVNVHFQTLTPRLRCHHSTPKHRMLLWTICNKLPGVEGKHTHTQKKHVFIYGETLRSENCCLASRFHSLEKVWCMGIKLTECLLIIEPFANCYGLNRGGIGHEERGAFSHLEVRSLLAGCHLSYNGKTRSKTWFHTDYKTEKSIRWWEYALMPVCRMRIMAVIGWEMGHGIIFKGVANNC